MWLSAAVFALGITAPTVHAATYVWNNTGNPWETGSDWTPSGPPTSADIASFDPTVANATGVIFNPTINAADAALTLDLNNNYLGGTYSFSGTGTLTVGTGGIVTRGFGTQTISGPTLAGAATGNLAFNVGTDSGLTLAGATTATTNAGALNLNGGTLTLDNSASTALHLSTLSVPSFVGGTLSILGNSAGTAYTLGAASFNGGFDTVSVSANGATSVNFANSSTFSLRTQTFMVEQFVSTTGVLGTAAGGLVTFTGTPFAGANGLLANSAGGGTVGFATVRDTSGVNFAVYTTPSAGTGGIAAATPTQTTASGAALQTYAATDRVQYNNAGTADTASATITNGSLRITATAVGGSLALGANNLVSNALMLDGSNNFTISGTGTFGATGTRYIYVNNAATSLTTSLVIANSTNPTDIAGPGFLVLNGTTSQNTLGTTNRLTLLGGVLRGNNTEIGFTSTGAGFLNFRGGVLEITNGTNGTGTSADFTRPLATVATAGDTNWSTNTTTDQGSGGFSAFGAAASVNLGGATAGVTWNTGGFVNDGYALKFGSTQSNAVLTFQNPIALDAGTTGLVYTAREINVTKGTGGDGTVLSGVVSGSASSDLLKTGTGTLTLTASNTYKGRTIVEGGTLVASSTSGTALGGTAGVIINAGGTVQMGAANQFSATTPAPLTLNGTSANAATFSVNGNSQGSTTANGVGALTLASGSSNNVIDFNSKNGVVTFASFAPNGATLSINNYLNNSGTSGGPDELVFNQDESANLGNIVFNGYGASTEANLGGGFFEVFPGAASVPEPATVAGGLLMVGALGWKLRRGAGRALPV